MNYIAREIVTDQNVQKTAGVKARDDVETIAVRSGFHVMNIDLPDEEERRNVNGIKKLWYHRIIQQKWDRSLKMLGEGDTLIIQFPIIHHTLLFNNTIQALQKRGTKVVLVIHDLEILRWARKGTTSRKMKIRMNLEERSILQKADYVIAHNSVMASLLEDLGVPCNRIIELKMFDYLIEEEDNRAELSKDGPVVIAGNLRKHKAGYAYHLPENGKYNLYGVGYEGSQTENIRYYGAFMPDELPGHLKGSFGLVWDGESTETCSGAYGEYLKINNPHKTSLYLASGMPVIIWKEAALAEYIEKNRCGITVASLNETEDRLTALTDEAYTEMAENARNISMHLRNGDYTKEAFRACGIQLEEK